VLYYLDSVPYIQEEFRIFVINATNFIYPGTEFLTKNITNTKQITTIKFNNESTFNEFIAWFNSEFPTFFNDRDAYCLANNISIVRTVEIS
jgi:hypothetical protein